MQKTIESKVSDTVLQSEKQVSIGKRVFTVAPPSIATMILVSQAIAKLPVVDPQTENIAAVSLAIAEDCESLGEIIATLILGAAAIKRDGAKQKSIFSWLTPKPKITVKELAETVLHELSPLELRLLMTELLAALNFSDFFSTTTFLSEINLLKPTKKVVDPMTQSGQQWPA